MLPALERLELNDSKNYQKTDLPSIKHSLLRSSEDHATVSTYNTNYVQFFYCYSEMTFEETMNYFNIMKQAHISGVAPVPVTSISSMSDGIDRNSSSLRTSLFSQDLSRDANVAFGCIAINDLISKNHITATCNVVISDYDPKTSDFYSYIRHPQIISDVFSRITLLLSNRGNPAYSFPYRLDYSTKDLFNNTGDIYADAF